MATATAEPRKGKHGKKRRNRPATPLEQTRHAVHRANGAAVDAVTGEAAQAPPVLLSDDLLYSRERMYVIAAASRFEHWLLSHIASIGVPLDDCLRPATLLPIYVEACLLLRVRYPAFRVQVEDEPDDEWFPRDEVEAVAVGLSVRRPRRRDRRPEPELPGCQGDGGTCARLRRFGERFCSVCRTSELRRLRGG